jgi:TraM recognition site of TraD and TraG
MDARCVNRVILGTAQAPTQNKGVPSAAREDGYGIRSCVTHRFSEAPAQNPFSGLTQTGESMLFKQKIRTTNPLDRLLMHLTQRDTVSVREILRSVAIFGASGSGKSSSSGLAILSAAVSAMPSAGLITASKPEDRGVIRRIFEAAGRVNDLIIFDMAGDRRFNFIDYEMRHGGHTRNIVRCILAIAESLRGGASNGSGEDGRFWEQESERMFYNAIEVLKVARGHVDAPSIQQFISTAAYSPAQIAAPEWQAGFNNQCLKQAFSREKTRIEQHDFDLARDYWLQEFPQMAEKTRSSILAHVLGILHVYNTGIVRELVSTTTNVSPDDILRGKWIFVDLSPSEYGDIGTFISCGWKYLLERRILQREAVPGDPLVMIFCDEAQQFLNSFDSHYLAQCRSHLGCLVCLTQSMHNIYAAMPGQTGRHQADALLGNFGYKIFHALADVQTAEYAAGLIGKSLQTFVGASMAPLGNLYNELSGHTQMTTSINEHFENILQPNRFMHGLRTGGPANNLICDAIIVRSGQPFANGENWIQVPFKQR